MIRGHTVLVDADRSPMSRRVDAELLGGPVQVTLQGVARLGCAVPPLGATGRLVGEHTDAAEPIVLV